MIKYHVLILNQDNQSFDLPSLPDKIDCDLRHCIYDNVEDGYFFPPVVFIEASTDRCLVVQVGRHRIAIPARYSIVVGDRDTAKLAVVPVTALVDQSHSVLVLNPISSFLPSFLPATVVGGGAQTDVAPKAMQHHLGAILQQPGAAPVALSNDTGDQRLYLGKLHRRPKPFCRS